MGTAPAFASVTEAIEAARAALGYLAAADAGALAAQTQAECLQGLEQTDAIATAARAGSAPGSAGRACRWTSGIARPSRPGFAMR
jgi:hypothetical protein